MEKLERKSGGRTAAKRHRGSALQPCKVGLDANWDFRRAKPTGGLASRSRVLTWQRRQNLAEAPGICAGICLRFVLALPSARDVDFNNTPRCPTTPGLQGLARNQCPAAFKKHQPFANLFPSLPFHFLHRRG